ncbi:MAG: hypothetical protein ACYTGV_03225 [Planctomycetota bacterium]|jgi:hypothetical protein
MRRAVIPSLVLLFMAASLAAAKPGFGNLYYAGNVVRTVVPPAAMPKPGTDDLYVVTDGVPTQLAVAAVAPGDRGYHGGKWAFHSVTWNVAAYLLTSEAEVLAAASMGDVTITRETEKDFKCPIQPSKPGDILLPE